MEETLNINLTNDEYPILEVSLVQAVGPKGEDGGWFNLKGDWSLGIAYVPYDLVNAVSGSYVCVTANIDSEPTVNNPDWMRLIYNVTDESKIDKASIKQTLGASTTDLLSQNIITTNINRIDGELSNKIDISQLSNYYTKSETYNKSEINSIAGGFSTKVVGDIEEMIDENTIYLISKNTPDQNNIYDKYIVFEGLPELLTDVSKSDLSNFITFNDLNGYVSDVDLNNLISNYYNKNSVYNKTEIDNLLANVDIDTSGFATIELLGEYIPISKIKQSTGTSTTDLMSQKATTDLINNILNGIQDDLDTRPTKPQIDDLLDDYIKGTLLGVEITDPRGPNIILNDKFIDKLDIDDLDTYIKGTLLGVDGTDPRDPNIILDDKINSGLTNGLTLDDLDVYIKDTLLGVDGTDPRGPNVILDDKLSNKLDATGLDAYIRDTLLGVDETDLRDPNVILGDRFAEKLDTADLNTSLSTTQTIIDIADSLYKKLDSASLNASLSTTSTIQGINYSLSNKVDVVSGSRLITSAELDILSSAVQPSSLSEYSKISSSEVMDVTDDLINDKYFIRAFDEVSGLEIKISTLSLHNSFSIKYPTARELTGTFDGKNTSFLFKHSFIESSAKLNINGLIYYIGHGFSIDTENNIVLDKPPISEDVIFIEAVYLD